MTGGATRLILLAVGVALAAQAGRPAAQAPLGPQKETLAGAENYTRVNAAVACGGATRPEAFAELKARGFAAVVNLRTAEEQGANLEAEQDAVRKAGLTYIHIPVRSDAPEMASIDTFLKAMADTSNLPVYIHCASGNRVGMMWLVKRVMIDDISFPNAAIEAQGIGLRSRPLMEFAYKYVKAHGK
jgi:uncharacterized protein (TIGR01244 family)